MMVKFPKQSAIGVMSLHGRYRTRCQAAPNEFPPEFAKDLRIYRIRGW
jgi:hypothetical protein